MSLSQCFFILSKILEGRCSGARAPDRFRNAGSSGPPHPSTVGFFSCLTALLSTFDEHCTGNVYTFIWRENVSIQDAFWLETGKERQTYRLVLPIRNFLFVLSRFIIISFILEEKKLQTKVAPL